MMFHTTSAAAAMALIASANAHMILNNPVPFGNMNSNPLSPDLSNFPCKLGGPSDYKVTTQNQWKAGETLQVAFTGSATHGGGSCQFSITTDKVPSKQSQWKVIHSVIGGCPSSAPGNLPDNAAGHDSDKFPVTMPKDVPDGDYTFAWTWFNKIGNREMYMNCAPITVSGGGKGDVAKTLGGLPDMVVANLPNTTCATFESFDYAFPNPGQGAVTGAKATPTTALNGAGCASMTKLGAGAGKLGSVTGPTNAPSGGASSAAASIQTPAPSAPAAASSAAASSGGVFAPGASSGGAAQTTVAVVASSAPAVVATSAPDAASSAAPAPSTGPTDGGAGGKVPCTTNGAVVCIGANQFGLCDRGFAVPQALAAGMACKNGQIGAAKRAARHARHHRRHGASL